MSSMRRYLAALLALVMLLSVFTGALGEEGIAAIEAGAEVLAAEAVEEEIADDAGEDEPVAAAEEEEIVAEVEAAELPEAEPSDEEAPANYDGEEAVDEAEDIGPVFASSNEGPEYFSGSETVFPERIDVFMECNGENFGEHCSVTDSDDVRFFADVFPRNALNPGIIWDGWVEEVHEDYVPDDEDYDEVDYPYPVVMVAQDGTLTVSNVHFQTDIVVRAQTAAYPDGTQRTPWSKTYVTGEFEQVYDEFEDEYYRGNPIKWIDAEGNEYVPIPEYEEDGETYDTEGWAIEWHGTIHWVQTDWSKTDEDKGIYYYYIEDAPYLEQEYHLSVYPTANNVRIYDADGRLIEDQVVLEPDETATFRVEIYPEHAMAGYGVSDESWDFVDSGDDVGENMIVSGEDSSTSYVFVGDNGTFQLAPVEGEAQPGESAYVIYSADGRADATLLVYRKPGELTGFSLTDAGKANPAVELGLKQSINLERYVVDSWEDYSFYNRLFQLEPEDAEPVLVFTTKDTKIVDLSENGWIYGKKKGTATVTVSAKGYDLPPLTLKVKVMEKAATKITLDKTYTAADGTGKTPFQLKATVTPAKASKRVAWVSSDVDVAVVDANGVVTPVNYGYAEIIAITLDGTNHAAGCMVEVVDPVDDIWFGLSGAFTYENAKGQQVSVLGVKAISEAMFDLHFAAQADEDDGAGDGDDSYSDDENNGDDYGDDDGDDDYDELDDHRWWGATLKTDKAGAKIITIKKNEYGETYVTGKKAGTAKVWLVSADGMYDGSKLNEFYYINVVKPVKVALSLSNDAGSVIKDRAFGIADVGELSGQYAVNISAKGNKVYDYIDGFTSTNEDVAYIAADDNGDFRLYFGGEAGKATITCQLADLASRGSMTVTVQRPIEHLYFEEWDKAQTYKVAKGKKLQLPMPYFAPSTSETDLIWETSNKAVATVSKTGLVTGKKVGGPVTITARSKANKAVFDTLEVIVTKPATKVTVLAEGGAQFATKANKWFFPKPDEERTINLSAEIAPVDGASQQAWMEDTKITYEGEGWAYMESDTELYVSEDYEGEVTITAHAADGTGKKGSATLVFGDYIESVQLAGNSPDGTEVWMDTSNPFDLWDNSLGTRLMVSRVGEAGSYEDDLGWTAEDDLTWSVTTAAGKKVISVNSHGRIFAKKAGSAVVRATAKDTGVSCDIPVRVYDMPASVTINGKTNGRIGLHGEGETVQLTATVIGQRKKAVPGGVYWIADSADGVSVNIETGEVTATSNEGFARVYAVPRCYDMTWWDSDYWDEDDEVHIVYDVPNAKVYDVVEITVSPEVDEVRVFGMHSVEAKKSITLVGRAYYEGGLSPDQSLTWSVKPGYEDILSIDSKTGVVTGKKAGRGYVLATANGMQQGNEANAPVCQFYVDVTEPINKIYILVDGEDWGYRYDELTYNWRNTVQLSVVCDPNNANPVVTWSSSDKKVLTVDANGIVRQAPGLKLKSQQSKKVTITATAVDKTGKKLSAKITIEISQPGE